ncbi:NAD-dependent protein deacetylase sirtuin-1-like isoform X2 [Oppia nitens]|uniref:NAD-dependent protein deacetylase sirtuin-1-like isoform X2 n=1 Tax=Oppia nitens TaxID=1686743 RepID=UPI0023DB8BA7|nr:NAD-dependent protein deacetylase sirtuin-1-like isoform X2 [Oppia nitens]
MFGVYRLAPICRPFSRRLVSQISRSMRRRVSYFSSTTDAEILSSSDSGFDGRFQDNKDIETINDSSIGCNDTNNYTNNLFISGGTNNDTTETSAHKHINAIEELVDNESQEVKDDYDCDDGASDVSDLSCISCLSDMSGQQWKPISGPVAWVHRQMCSGTDPRTILTEMVADNTLIPDNLDNLTIWRIIVNMLSEPPPRRKLVNYNTIDDCVKLINKCNRIVVLTGAGVSVSCGIPDFRSRDGIYARLSKDFPDLPDPQAMFDIHYFRRDPRPFFKFAKEIYPGLFKPSISHRFIRFLENKNKLLRNYTQNIDTLEKAAGIDRVITCHGSFATATCTHCKYRVDASVIKDDIFEQRIPKCPHCPPDLDDMAVMKPDIVFFGEGLSDEFHSAMSHDKDDCDLLIVMGSSLKVRPVALIPNSIPESVPQILINREPLNHLTFDIELLGDCDVIVKQLCQRLGLDWDEFCLGFNSNKETLNETKISENFSLEVNNNSTQINSLLPFAFNTTVNELSVKTDNKHNIDDLNPDSTQTDTPKSSDDQLISQLTDENYIYITPSRYIFKGAEVYDRDFSTNKNTDDSEDDNSNSSLSTTPCSSSSSSSPSLNTSDSLLSPINSNSCKKFAETCETITSYSYSTQISSDFLIPSENTDNSKT